MFRWVLSSKRWRILSPTLIVTVDRRVRVELESLLDKSFLFTDDLWWSLALKHPIGYGFSHSVMGKAGIYACQTENSVVSEVSIFNAAW